MITFTANIRSASAATDDAITTSSVGIPITLNLSTNFDGLAKTLCFKTPTASVNIALVGDATESVVPPDVLVKQGEWLNIGIYAADESGNIVIPTVWANAGIIQLGTLPSGVDPSAPTPSWVAQVQNIASEAIQNSEQAIETANDAKEAAITAQDSAQASASAAAQSAADAGNSANAAAGSATDASESADAASGSASTASTKAGEAAASATTASGAAATATTQAGNASDSAAAAAGSAATAAQKASEAAQSATQAANSASSASTSATAAGTAQGKAEDAQEAAEEAQAAAEAAAAQSVNKADRVSGATAGNVAKLDANGNLADAGHKYNPDPKDETMPLRVGVDSSGRLWASGDSGSERFGVKGVGGAATALTRLWDAVGLTATPGTDAVAGSSDFDAFPVFNRRKCVGSWSLVDGKAVFTVQAYEGDADYAEDGSMGDYVAVDVTPIYWYHDEATGTLGVSGGAHPGWEPHPVCLDKDGNIREHTYLPVYALALKDGHAVSLPGYDNSFGNFKNLWDAARTYGDGTLTNKAIIEPSVVDHYEWLLMTIEFATTNMQTVMNGAVSMPYNTNHTITAAPGANKIVLTAAIGDTFTVGQTIYIGSDHGATPSNVSAYNHVTAIEKCDADGTLNDSGSYRLVTYDGTDRTSSITGGTTKVSSRPWITGATAGAAPNLPAVQGHTGSPLSNSNGRMPFRYRWRENGYGNQNMTALDLFDARTADDTSYHLDWYYNDALRFDGAALYYPSSMLKPDLTDLQTAANGFRKLTTTTTKEHYADGYIKEEGFDADLPCIRVPTVTGSPASASAYYADYASLVNSIAVRAVRRRGPLSYGAIYGPRYVYALSAPSNASWYYGAALYMAQ